MEDNLSVDEGMSEVSYGRGTLYQFNTRLKTNNKPVTAKPQRA